ncbi:MAG: WD40 repeat domain-containing protein [Bacteroidota bacterium]
MRTILLISVLFLLTAALVPGCDSSVPLAFTNPFDPVSKNYIPPDPNGLSALLKGDSVVALTWSDNSLGEDGYAVERSADDSSSFVQIAQLPPNRTLFEDSVIFFQQTRYYYRIGVLKNGVKTGFSNTVACRFTFATLTKPFFTFDTQHSCILYFGSYIPTGSTIVERSTDDGAYSQIAVVPGTVTAYRDSLLDSTRTYSYRYKISTGRNVSEYSPTVSIAFSFTDAVIVRTLDLGKPVHSIVFSPDGTTVAAVGMSYGFKIWNVSNGSLKRNFSYTGTNVISQGWPFQCAFRADGKLIVSHSDTNSGTRLVVYNIETGAIVKSLSTSGYGVSFLGNSDKIISGDFNGNISVINIPNDSVEQSWQGHYGGSSVSLVRSIKNGGEILTGANGSNEYLHWWNTNTWTVQKSVYGFSSAFYSVSGNETKLSAGPIVADLLNGTIIRTFENFPSGGTAFIDKDRFILVKGYNGTLSVYNIAQGNLLISKPSVLPNIYTNPAIASSPVNDRVFAAAGAASGQIDIWVVKNSWKVF